jgi:hypothetical protein
MTRTRTRAAIVAAALLAVTLLGGGAANAAGDAHVGAGAAPAVTCVTVPDVIYQSEADAVAELTLLGFRIQSEHEYTTIVCTQPVPPPTVIEQAPAGGSMVIRGANISLGVTDYKVLANEC